MMHLRHSSPSYVTSSDIFFLALVQTGYSSLLSNENTIPATSIFTPQSRALPPWIA